MTFFFFVPFPFFGRCHPQSLVSPCHSLYSICFTSKRCLYSFYFLARIQGHLSWNRHCSNFPANHLALYKKELLVRRSDQLKQHQSNMECFRQIFRCLKAPLRRDKGRIIEIVRRVELRESGLPLQRQSLTNL